MELKFHKKKLKKLYFNDDESGFPAHHVERIQKILEIMGTATSLKSIRDLTMGYGFHKLSGDRRGQYAVTVKANYRIVFEINEEQEAVVNIDYLDYHESKNAG